MPIVTVVWLAVCAAGLILSLASARVLDARSRATQFGWLATAAYFVVAGVDAARASSAPLHADYVLVALLTIAFVMAGRRDEPQAEPWYRPTHAGLTGRERRLREPE